MVIFHSAAVKKNSFAKHPAASTLHLPLRWPSSSGGWHCAAASGRLWTCAPPPFARPGALPLPPARGPPQTLVSFVSPASSLPPSLLPSRTPVAVEIRRIRSASFDSSRPYLYLSVRGLFEPSPARLLRRTALPATTSAIPRISLAPAPTAGRRRWAERSNTPTGGSFPMSGFFFKASPQGPQTLTSPHRVPLASPFVFSA